MLCSGIDICQSAATIWKNIFPLIIIVAFPFSNASVKKKNFPITSTVYEKVRYVQTINNYYMPPICKIVVIGHSCILERHKLSGHEFSSSRKD